MAIVPLRIRSGVNVEQTQTLNDGGWSYSTLIRFFGGLAQKIGGWVQYTTFNIVGLVRGMHPWQALSTTKYLGIATENYVYAVTGNTGTDITPISHISSGMSIIFFNGNGTANFVDNGGFFASVGQYIIFPLPIVAGGSYVFSGAYQIISVSPPGFTVKLTAPSALLGFQSYQMPSISVTSGSKIGTITNLPNTYRVGDVFTLGLGQSIGGFFVQADNYIVLSIVSPTRFTFQLDAASTATATGQMNGGLTYQVYAPNSGSSLGPASLQYQFWTMDNWGEFLIICPYLGSIYVWQPQIGGQAQIIGTAPNTNIGIFIAMPEQILVAYGSSQGGTWNPLEIAWSDVSDYTNWIPSSTNFAGSFVLPSGSSIVKGIQAPQQMLFWTDIELWAGQYVGQPFVFGFSKIGQSCGLIAAGAVAVVNNGIYWMSQSQFFLLNGSGVAAIPCSVWDFVFQNLNPALVGKIIAAPNSFFNEISWFFPSVLSNQENDAYVKLNTATGEWDYGYMSRTSWIDQSILGSPIGGDQYGTIFQHEVGYNQVSTHINPAQPIQPIAPSIQTGYIMIADGDKEIFVDQIYPDIRFGQFTAQFLQTNSAVTTKGTVMMTVYMVDYPGDEPMQYGPYPVDSRTRWIDLQARGRQMSVKFSSDDLDSFWRVGMPRYRASAAGRY